MPKISIVIPVYNVAPYIAECLQSVKNQTWQGWLECILVDDCGTDDSMSIVERELEGYQGKVNFRIVHHEKNRGLSAARNSGIDAAQGDYVYFLDSDDEISVDCIEQLALPLQEEGFDLVVGDYRITGSDVTMSQLLLPDGTSLYNGEILHAYRKLEWYMLSVNKLYRMDFLNRFHLRFLEGIIHEDELWSFQIACLAQTLKAVGRKTYIYKIRNGSITGRRNPETRCRCINIILKNMCEFRHSHHLQQNKDVHNYIQNFQMITLYSVYSDSPGLLSRFYREQREMMDTTWSHCLIMNGVDVRKQVRDFHVQLPIAMALPYLKLLFHFL